MWVSKPLCHHVSILLSSLVTFEEQALNWTKEYVVIDGESVVLNCSIQGYPLPVLTWKSKYGVILG